MAPIFIKLTLTQLHRMEISPTEFYPDREKHVQNTGTFSFMTPNKA
jgi:hypothetical protein